MEVAINPNLYGTAQAYAEQQGLNLTAVIEGFLKRFISAKESINDPDVPDVVLGLLGAAGGQVPQGDLNGREAYYQFVEKKHQ